MIRSDRTKASEERAIETVNMAAEVLGTLHGMTINAEAGDFRDEEQLLMRTTAPSRKDNVTRARAPFRKALAAVFERGTHERAFDALNPKRKQRTFTASAHCLLAQGRERLNERLKVWSLSKFAGGSCENTIDRPKQPRWRAIPLTAKHASEMSTAQLAKLGSKLAASSEAMALINPEDRVQAHQFFDFYTERQHILSGHAASLLQQR